MPWRKKCTPAAPTDASGSTSRGNDTFFTSAAYITTDVVPLSTAPEKKFHTSTPQSKKIGKRGMVLPRILPNANQYTTSTSNGFNSDQANPRIEFLYLTLSSFLT